MKKKVLLGSLLFITILGVSFTLVNELFYENNNNLKEEQNYIEINSNTIAAYIEQEDGSYKESSSIPNSGYLLNNEKSSCNNGVIPKIDSTSKRFYLDNYIKGKTSCYLYFDKNPYVARDYILANKNISERTDFSQVLTTDTTGTIYKAEDDYGDTYYYAGAPTDNWVKFGEFYWRIIRVNGDGTIRMIYNGTSTNQTGTDTQIGTSVFNSTADNNAFVGFMYESGVVHGNKIESTIKRVLDPWYNNNIPAAEKLKVDSNAGFCNDRVPVSGTGTGTSQTYYAAHIRLITNKTPDFKCKESSDNFKTSVGLITADEVAYAGGVQNTNNTGYYLYTGQDYWALSPDGYSGSHAFVFGVYANGNLDGISVYSPVGIRPTINLRADVQLTGQGTASLPYQIEGLD